MGHNKNPLEMVKNLRIQLNQFEPSCNSFHILSEPKTRGFGQAFTTNENYDRNVQGWVLPRLCIQRISQGPDPSSLESGYREWQWGQSAIFDCCCACFGYDELEGSSVTITSAPHSTHWQCPDSSSVELRYWEWQWGQSARARASGSNPSRIDRCPPTS